MYSHHRVRAGPFKRCTSTQIFGPNGADPDAINIARPATALRLSSNGLARTAAPFQEFNWQGRIARGISVNQDQIETDSIYEHCPYQDHKLQAYHHSTQSQERPTIDTGAFPANEHVLPENLDRDIITKKLCILSLGLGWAISIALLAIGVAVVRSKPIAPPPFLKGKMVQMGALEYPWTKAKTLYLPGHRAFSLPEFATNILPLLLNIALTIVFDCINYIPTVALRWALWEEGRLHFSANSRLLTRTKKHICSSWYSNLSSMAAMIIAYGATSIVFYQIKIIGELDDRGHLINKPFSGPRYGIDLNGWGSIGLGVGLTIQCLISTLCFSSTAEVKTWSSNPLATARACVAAEYARAASLFGERHDPSYIYGQSLPASRVYSTKSSPTSPGTSATYSPKSPQYTVAEASVSSNTSLRSISTERGILSRPLSKQLSMKEFRAQTYRFVIAIWIVFAVFALATVIIAAVAHKKHTLSAAYINSVAEIPNHPTTADYWASYGQVYSPFCRTAWTKRRDWLALIIQCVELAVILLGLHCAELLVQLARDEMIWRKAATTGSSPDIGSLIAGIPCVPYWVLFVFKFIVPWAFGQGFDANCLVFASLLPVAVLTFLLLLLALFAEFIVRRRPSGFQPPTYGHIRSLASLVDEWQHKKIFWGDKGKISDFVHRAGSNGRRMQDLRSSCLYTGIRTKEN